MPRSWHPAALVVLLAGLFLVGATVAHAADLVVLTEENWDEYALGGPEADAVLGDYVLRNDKITVVVGNHQFISGRSGSRNSRYYRAAIIDAAPRDRPTDYLDKYLIGPSVGNTIAVHYNATAQYRPDYAADFKSQHGEEVVLALRPSPHYSYFCPQETRYTLRDGEAFIRITVEFYNKGTPPVKDEPYWVKRDRRQAEAAIAAAEAAENGDPEDELAALLNTDDNGPLPDAGLKRGETGPEPEPFSCQCPAPEKLEHFSLETLHGTSMEGALTWSYNPTAKVAYAAWAPNEKGASTIKGEGSYTLERIFIPGSSLAEVQAIARDLAKAEAARHAVTFAVTDGAGPVADTQVSVYRSKLLLNAGTTDAAGRVTLDLPAGKYRVDAVGPGEVATSQEIMIAGPMDAPIGLPTPSRLAVRVTDAAGGPLPCRVSVTGRDGTVDPDFGPADGIRLVANNLHTPDGTGALLLKPGAYRVTISRGPEYDQVTKDVNVTAGQTVEVVATLRRVVDTTGWISADLHSHTSVTGVSRTTGTSTGDPKGHVLRLLAEQFDFAPAAEHDRVYDYSPLIARLGMQSQLASCPGIGLTDGGRKYAYNHQTSFPIRYEPHWLDGGSIQRPQHCGQIQWLRSWGNEIEIDEPWLAARNPDTGYEKLIIVQADDNKHAALHIKDYNLLSAMYRGQDIITFWNDDRAHIKTFLRDSDGDGTLDRITYEFDRHCDAWDIGDLAALADPAADQENDILDWIETRRHGHRLTGVATSRSYTNAPGPTHVRSYVRSRTDEPSQIEPLDVVRAIKAGHVMMTTGPFLDFQVVADTTGGPGDDITTSTGQVELRVRVQAPDWIRIEQIQILRDGVPDAALTFDRTTHPDRFADGVVVVDQTLPVSMAKDTHFIAVVRGRTVGSEAMDQAAITNPIYVDRGTDGFTPQDPQLDTVFSKMKLVRSLRSDMEAPPAQVEITLVNFGETAARDTVTLHVVPAGTAEIVGDPDLSYDIPPGERKTLIVELKLKGDAQMDAMLGDKPVAFTLWLDRSGLAPGRAPARLVIAPDAAADAQMMIDDETKIHDDWQQ